MRNRWMVSVLTPVHHTPISLLERAFSSLRDQSFGFENIQWVVLLHNCTDDYARQAVKLLDGYPNIRICSVNKEGTGVSFARNHTLSGAEGRYVFFLDSDDEMMPNCIEDTVSAMEEARACTAIYTAEAVSETGVSYYWTDLDPALGSAVYEKGDQRIADAMCISGMTLWTRCYRRDFLAQANCSFDEDLNFGEDYLFNIEATGKAERVCLLPALCGYRYYVNIGMTKGMLGEADRHFSLETDKRQGGEGTGLFLIRLYHAGLKQGLGLNNVMCKLIALFGRLYLFSGLPDEMKQSFVHTVSGLISILKPPVTRWHEKQAELDKDYSFIQSLASMYPQKKQPVIFVFVNPAWGHAGPLLGVIRGLAGRGFHVRVYSGKEVAEQVENTGAVCICNDRLFDAIDIPYSAALGHFKWIEYARRMDDVIGREILAWQPVLAVVDASAVWGRLLALKYGLKTVFSSATMMMSDDTRIYWQPLMDELAADTDSINERLRELHSEGFPTCDLESLYRIGRDEDRIVYCSKTVQPCAESFDPGHVFYAGYSRLLPEKTDWQDRAPSGKSAKRPLIYVTLGTVSSINIWFFRSCIAAFAGMDADVVMAVWKNIDMKMLGDIPPNMQVNRVVDQAEILSRADVAVFHAGMNTLSDCLLMGVPVVAYPNFGDQPGNGRRIEELKAGIVIGDHRPETIRDAVEIILTDSAYRRNAKTLGDDMRSYGGGEQAAEWIVSKARDISAVRKEELRILGRCAAGWVHMSGKEQRRQVIYMAVETGDRINADALEKALADTAAHFPVIQECLVKLNEEYYCARSSYPLAVGLYTGERKIGDSGNGWHSFDVSIDNTRIILCADHAIMDGQALMQVTDHIIYRYDQYAGVCREGRPEAVSRGYGKDEDLFALPCEGETFPVRGFTTGAYQPSFAKEELSKLREFIVPTEQVLTLCRELAASPAVLFTLLLYEAIDRCADAGRKEHIVAALPIDYRKALKLTDNIRTAAFSMLVDLDSDEWADMDFKDRAKILRRRISEHTDARFARGWVRFYKDFVILLNRQLLLGSGKKREFDAYTFMLSYLRPSPCGVYAGKEVVFAGVSVPNDFTMVEYNGSFHLFFRAFDAERFPSSFTETFKAHGFDVKMKDTDGVNVTSTPPCIITRELPPAVFVFVSPAYGHVTPLLALIGELVRYGFMVRVYTGGEMRERIERTGAVCISFDAWYDRLTIPEYAAYGFLRMLELAESMEETVELDVRTFQPRFAVVDTLSIWGKLLAEKNGLKIVLSSATQIMNIFTISEDWRLFFKKLEPYEERMEQMLHKLAGKGFRKHTILSLLCPGKEEDCVAYIPLSLQGQPDTIDQRRVFFAGYSREIPGGRDHKTDPGRSGRPLIYVTMGTVVSHSPRFFRNCMKALGDMEADVVIAVWNYIDIGMLGEIPQNITLKRVVNQEEILSKADAAIFHAGLNTITDCLLLGVPMVVYPTVADQFGNAKRVEETGTGVCIGDDKPDTIREALVTVLTNPSYRRKTAEIAKEMRSMGGAKRAAKWIVGRMGCHEI